MSKTAPPLQTAIRTHRAGDRRIDLSEAPIDECLLNDAKQRANYLGAICD